MSKGSDSSIIIEGVGKRQRLLTGNKGFDQYFGIMSGTSTIIYVQNQTYFDPLALMINWFTNSVEKTDTLILVTTYANPIDIARWCERRLPNAFSTFVKTSREERFWWIDLFTYRGFGEHEQAKIHIGYTEHLKQLGGKPGILIMPRKPNELQSVEGLPAAINKITNQIHGKGNIRLLMAYVDDFVDEVGPQAALTYLRRLINLMRKFGHTLILHTTWRGSTPEFHTSCERMVDQVLRWGYGNVPGQKQHSKFLQILKTTAPDEMATYLKVPYQMKDRTPTILKRTIHPKTDRLAKSDSKT
ncbi:MAG: hypothetical protein ACFFDP_13450 [Promethearchaeota archaeon]